MQARRWIAEGAGVPSRRVAAGDDKRITFVAEDAGIWLDRGAPKGPRFDLAYVDWRRGKFERLPDLLALLKPGGLYVVDETCCPRPHDPMTTSSASTASSSTCPGSATSVPCRSGGRPGGSSAPVSDGLS
ncbi:hypothetical protein ACWD4J_22375 [Streptomyces sp. NPDC002577]